MKPLDYRNATFADLQARVHGDRLAVLEAWRVHGPGTTREVAQRAGMDLLSFRPRTTELLQLGLIDLEKEEGGRRKAEGTYAALSAAQALALFEERQAELLHAATQLPLPKLPV